MKGLDLARAPRARRPLEFPWAEPQEFPKAEKLLLGWLLWLHLQYQGFQQVFPSLPYSRSILLKMKLQNLGFFPHLTFADKPEINFPILTNLSKLAPKEV